MCGCNRRVKKVNGNSKEIKPPSQPVRQVRNLRWRNVTPPPAPPKK